MATMEMFFFKHYKNGIHLLVLLIIATSLIYTTTAVEYCYFGKNIKTISGFQNQTCSDGDLHILSKLLDTEQQTTLTSDKGREYTSSQAYFSQPELEASNINKDFCYIFRHVSINPLTSDTIHESIQVQYGCDFNNHCANRKLDHIINNVTLNNHTGKLYCCSKNNCNDLEKVHSPTENRVCYEGTKNISTTSVGGLKYCQHPDATCAKSTQYMPEGKIEKYFCDNENLCSDKLILSGAFQTCSNTTESNITRELCCCDQSKCYSALWLNSSYVEEDLTSKHLPSLAQMDKTIEKPGEDRFSNMLITGLVTVLVFFCAVGAGAVFVLACKKRRKLKQDPNVIMQYERLSSDIDVDEAVVL